MNQYMEAQLKELSEEGMLLLYEDTICRIQSHVINNDPDPNYIRKQEEILRMIQEELQKRKNKN